MPTHWTDDDKEQVASLLKDGLSRAQIAKQFRVSRNSISGLIDRNSSLRALGCVNENLPIRRGKALPKEDRPAPKPRTNDALMAVNIQNKIARKAKEAPRLAPAPVVELFKPTPSFGPGVPLMSLERGQCRFPVNDAYGDELHLFCAAPVDPRGSVMGACYCAAHHALAVTPARPATIASKTIGSWAA